MSIWQLPMGTYYSQLAGGFLFSEQSAPRLPQRVEGRTRTACRCSCRADKLCEWSGVAPGFSITQKASTFQKDYIIKTKAAEHRGSPVLFLIIISPIHLLHLGDEMIDFPCVNICSEPWVVLKGPCCSWSEDPAMLDSIMQLTSITRPPPAEHLEEKNTPSKRGDAALISACDG